MGEPRFEEIKQRVSIIDVVKRYGVELRGRGDWRNANCPLPTHESKNSKSKFIVNVPQNFWLCHSDSCRQNKNGKKGGDVISFVQVMEKCGMGEAAEMLRTWYGLNGNEKPPRSATVPIGGSAAKRDTAIITSNSTELPKENKPLSFAGFKDLDPTHDYLRSRGIRITTAEEFGVGFFPGRSSVIKDPYRIVIPVHNASGMLVAYVGRSLDPQAEERYHFPPGYFKTLDLYNLHRVFDDTVVVVEGFFGAMHLWQEGYENTVALMGSTISDVQLKLLKRFRYAVLMLDGDKAGREGTDVIAAKIAKQQYVTAVTLPDGYQPENLSSADLAALLAPMLSA